MKSYAAFLRGVSPMNTKTPELKRALEVAGFTGVRTVLSSGNVVFSAPLASEAALERKAEAAMKKHLGYAYLTIVRPIDALRSMLATDPYKSFRLKPTDEEASSPGAEELHNSGAGSRFPSLAHIIDDIAVGERRGAESSVHPQAR